jgi:ribosomal protein S18 acetylase RimI-like enzyme
MNFAYTTESIRTAALHLDYYLVPWDTEILGVPVAQIADVRVADAAGASRDYEEFARWCTRQRIALCACRLPSDRVADAMFLEERGFRFVELNYLPQLTGLQALELAQTGIDIETATAEDREPLAAIAAQVFRHGRFHQDPRIDPALGDCRYGAWLRNAFEHSGQRVLKCLLDGAIVGFFVVETPAPTQCFWSLTALAPGLQGRGLGKRVWHAMLRHHRSEDVDVVTTSISSHNVPVFNLYAALGFRFPAPSVTLQWVSEPLRAPARAA